MDRAELRYYLENPSTVPNYNKEEKMNIIHKSHGFYGTKHVVLAIEEISELILEMMKYQAHEDDDGLLAIAEEWTDVKIMTDVIQCVCMIEDHRRPLPKYNKDNFDSIFTSSDIVELVYEDIIEDLVRSQKDICKFIRGDKTQNQMLQLIITLDNALSFIRYHYGLDSSDPYILSKIEMIKYHRLITRLEEGTLT